jgi:predicted sulfurtransferase
MDRTFYTFDKRIAPVNYRLRLQIVICAAPDCRTVLHCTKKQGQQKQWCSDRCYQRIRARRLRRQRGVVPRGPRQPRYKGVLGVGHYNFGA